MFFRVMLFVWQFVLDLVVVIRMTDDEKDLEILLLRQQLQIVSGRRGRKSRGNEKPLAALASDGGERTRSRGEKCAVVQTRHSDWLASGHRAPQVDLQAGATAWTSARGQHLGRLDSPGGA
jgi:hypothetical protein